MTRTADANPAEAEGPRRADAVRNREKVIAAAEQVFAEQGIEAGIPEIAERAGVGKGTVYRNFESKDDLVAAIVSRRLSRMDDEIVTALEGPDPMASLRTVLGDAAARTSALSFPPGIYVSGRHAELDKVKKRVRKHMGELFRMAQDAGQIRADATVDELFVLFGGACRSLAEAGQGSPKLWRRHADLVVDAFRPPAG